MNIVITILVLLMLFFLGGCAKPNVSLSELQTQAAISAGKIEIPDHLRHCMKRPVRPEGKLTVAQSNAHVRGLYAWGIDCESKVIAIDELARGDR